jgi:siroheme synthase
MTVYLVGAGPGDPELITVKAARLIALADVIVHDRLADNSIIQLASPGVDLIDVGKKPVLLPRKKPLMHYSFTSVLKASMWCA